MSGHKMTTKEAYTVHQWMLENAETVATLTPKQLAEAVDTQCEVMLTPSTAARHRKEIGIKAIKQPREPKPKRETLASRVAALEERVQTLEGLVQP